MGYWALLLGVTLGSLLGLLLYRILDKADSIREESHNTPDVEKEPAARGRKSIEE
jgi:hypothetical protein